MKVDFKRCVVREVRSGTSKNGNPYCVVRFLSDEPEMYEVFFSGSDVQFAEVLCKGSTYDFCFDLVPGFRGGVVLAFDGPAKLVADSVK